MGQYFTYKDKVALKTYYRLRAKKHEDDIDTTAKHVYELVEASIKRQMDQVHAFFFKRWFRQQYHHSGMCKGNIRLAYLSLAYTKQ